MKKIGLVFPHQLYKNSTLVEECEKIYLIEDDLYFNQYKFHKQKLVLHRASMKYYADYISDKTSVIYIQSTDKLSLESILEKNQKIKFITLFLMITCSIEESTGLLKNIMLNPFNMKIPIL